jgi:pilus assembly protein CpaB
MNRGLRTAVVLIVAVAAAGIASFGVYLAVKNVPVREVEVARVFAVVAARNLPAGAMIAADDVKVVPWPAANALPGGFATPDRVVGRGLVASVVENEPITQTKLAPRGAGAGLPPTIPAGMRAISVKVNEVIGVAGFVLPGTRVDVLVTVNQQDPVARTVVPNLLVLTAGTRYDQEQAKDGKPVPSTVVTLAVTPQDAERITLAAGSGSIMLALRNPLDTDTVETAGVRMSGLFGPASPRPAAAPRPRNVSVTPPPPPPSPPPPYTVETIRAAKRTEEVVR